MIKSTMNPKKKSKECSDSVEASASNAPSPFELAQIAVLLASKKSSASPCDFFPETRELLRQSASFLNKQNAKMLTDFMQVSGVSFADILESNNKNNPAEKKLLPRITTEEGLVKLIRRYYAQRGIRLSEGTQNAIKAKTGQTLTVIQDQTGEDFISGKYLPSAILIQIQEWREAQQAKNALKRRRNSRQ
jgi:hypothetical protein